MPRILQYFDFLYKLLKAPVSAILIIEVNDFYSNMEPKFSIIVPCFNEEETIKAVLKKLLQLELKSEIIVVDDASTDSTKKRLNQFKNSERLKVFFHEKNRGKGAAIRTALERVEGEYVGIQDGDLEYNPGDLEDLFNYAASNELQVLYGSRFLNCLRPQGMAFSNFLGNLFLTFLTNLLYQAEISDEATAYKVFKTPLLKRINLRARGFEFCPEVTAKLLKQGEKIEELPISYQGRSYESGKKIRFRDGILASWVLLKLRFK